MLALVPSYAFATESESAEMSSAVTKSNLPRSGTWGTCPWEIDAKGTLVVHPGKGTDDLPPWMASHGKMRNDVKEIVFKAEGGKKAKAPSSCKNLFCDFYLGGSVTSIDCSGLDTSEVTDMSWMFSYNVSLQKLDIRSLDTSNVKNMSYMFSGCVALKYLDVSGFNTSKVEDMYAMFGGANEEVHGVGVEELDLSNFDTSKVTCMGSMFNECLNLKKVMLSSFDTSNVSGESGFVQMFHGCIKLQTLDLSCFDTSKSTNMYWMFGDCSSLTSLDLSSFDTSRVTDMAWMFDGCSSLTFLDLSSFDTLKVTRFSSDSYNSGVLRKKAVFDGCDKLDTVKLGSRFSFKGALAEPQFTLPDKSWRSVQDGKTYTAQQIATSRSNIADTYTTLVPPKIVEGTSNAMWSAGSATKVWFRFDAPLALFIEVRVDGQAIASSSYSLSEGSTVVELKPTYLNTLSDGKHTLDIVSQNGTATSTFNIVKDTSTISLAGKWIRGSKGWWYEYSDGSYARGLLKIGSASYYFDNNGWMKTGWQHAMGNGDWYYFDGSGAMKTGWQKVGGKWYYMASDGKMQTGWVDGDKYYCNGSGAMVTGWQKLSNTWYYFNGSGAKTTGWQKVGGAWYYMASDGKMLTGKQSVGNKTYFLASSGAMRANWYKHDDGAWYWLGSDGAAKTGWQKVGGKWYYHASDGKMQTGWVDGDKYYCNSSGAMLTGWQKVGGDWYYFNSSGAKQAKRWVGKYWVGSDGKMVTSQWVKGTNHDYWVDASGRWTGALR